MIGFVISEKDAVSLLGLSDTFIEYKGVKHFLYVESVWECTSHPYDGITRVFTFVHHEGYTLTVTTHAINRIAEVKVVGWTS